MGTRTVDALTIKERQNDKDKTRRNEQEWRQCVTTGLQSASYSYAAVQGEDLNWHIDSFKWTWISCFCHVDVETICVEIMFRRRWRHDVVFARVRNSFNCNQLSTLTFLFHDPFYDWHAFIIRSLSRATTSKIKVTPLRDTRRIVAYAWRFVSSSATISFKFLENRSLSDPYVISYQILITWIELKSRRHFPFLRLRSRKHDRVDFLLSRRLSCRFSFRDGERKNVKWRSLIYALK